ncbi:sensor histidine kinase [Caldibacillus debilis]|jgi:OmpR family two-component system bacitracin resistance sensor histidine kinase BceS|uniref:histidine kinase n=1 Tax=Caldibacillus debilis GB1 TaxID=1339248 RepID=A0A420VGY1_9BACI|nr:sensor histidine kinase [Caldibacillus debilis]RKO62668.1 Signal transduction histidine kinase [Caldibacillus debilis GB1]
MIRKFFLERASWILFFLFVESFFLFIAYLDAAVPFDSILYMVFLSSILFLLFLAFRYRKETEFYRNLEEREGDLDYASVPEGESPFEKIVSEKMQSLLDDYRRKLAKNRLSLEQEKDELLSWIHEMKTPLSAMHLMIDRVADETLRDQLTYEWLRIHLLLDKQLHQKRIATMENDVFIEQVALEPVIFQEIKALRSWCISKGIGFDVSLEAEDVLTDGKWLSFILRQILTNAVKYSESADILIKSEKKGEHVRLEITDFGRGIDPRDLPRIFDKGFTSAKDHQNSGATGMGLYLAKKAADFLHIRIDVKSKPGEGTTFILTFPKKNEFVRLAGM